MGMSQNIRLMGMRLYPFIAYFGVTLRLFNKQLNLTTIRFCIKEIIK